MFRLHACGSNGGRRRLGLGVATATVLLAAAAPAQAAPFAYVGLEQNDEVAQYDVGSGGLLAPLSPFTVAAGKLPDNVAMSPDGKSVYVGNTGLLYDDPEDEPGSISQYDVAADGTLSPKSPAKVTSCGATAHQVAISPDGNSAYVATGADCSRVYQYDIGGGGALSPKSPAFVDVANDNGQPIGVAVSPDSQSVYVTDHNSGRVYQYDVGAGGALTPKSPPTVAAGDFSLGVAVTPDGQSVYVTNSGLYASPSRGTVSQYDVGAGGALTPKSPPTVAAGIEPWSLIVSPDGKSAYVVEQANDNVLQYDIDPANGALSAKAPATVATGDRPVGIAATPDGLSVYVTNYRDENVSQYDAGAGGELSAKSPATVAAARPTGIAVSPLARPTTKEQCKHGGWKQFGFKNQGRCIRFVKRRARQGCRAERDAIGSHAFRERYGKGRHDRCAMRSCVKQAIGAR